MIKIASVMLVGVTLSSCVTADQQAQNEEVRFASFRGMTMAQFTAETMVTPHDYYLSENRRVFIAEKLAPNPMFKCTIHLETIPVGAGVNADNWKIVQTRRQGACGII